MTVRELFDKYCKFEDGEYIVHGHFDGNVGGISQRRL